MLQAKGRPYIITFVGVNGVGKSTNLAKVGCLCSARLQRKGGQLRCKSPASLAARTWVIGEGSVRMVGEPTNLAKVGGQVVSVGHTQTCTCWSIVGTSPPAWRAQGVVSLQVQANGPSR